jgi:hypothetical protein
MPPSRPRWLTSKDLLFPGSLVPLVLIALLCAGTSRCQSTAKAWGLPAGLIGVQGTLGILLLGVTAVYANLLWRRRRLLEPFIYIRGPFYSVMIHPGSYKGALDPEVVIGQFFFTFDCWQKAFRWSQIRDFADGAMFWVWLKPNLAGSCCAGEKMPLPGFDVARSHKMVVSYRRSVEPLSQTTLQHELGHLLQGALTRSWTVQGHHDRAQDLGLR